MDKDYQQTIEALLKRMGYCPYCGGELTPAAYDMNNEWLEWAPCRMALCYGEITTIITDTYGFVVSPKSKERTYIYKRNLSSHCGKKGKR